MQFLRAYLPAWLHDEINSFRLFKEAKSGLQIIKYFSQRHSLHLLEVGLCVVACFKILHVTLNFVKFSFKYQMYFLSSVLCLFFALANENLGFAYLVLKEFSAILVPRRSGEGYDPLSRRYLGKQPIP